jgi:biotin-(acetyl-CoA carboxylase) ligase
VVTAIMNGKEITGSASGIDETGALILTASDGTVQKVRAGDVTLRK